DSAPREVLRLEHRASGLSWMHDTELLLARDYDRDRGCTRVRLFGRGDVAENAITLDDRSARDRYGDPGSILFEPAARGRRIVRQRDEWIFRSGDRETAEGARPVLHRQSVS